MPVSNYEYELQINDKRRELYILRPEFIDSFISQFEGLTEYKPSASYIDRTTKKSGI
jgi:hypothetical protein